MRQLVRSLRTCEAGAGLVEYSLLIAVVAVGLIGTLRLYRSVVGDLTTRTAVSISAQAGSGYGVQASERSIPMGGRPTARRQDPADPDSSSTGITEATAATLLIP